MGSFLGDFQAGLPDFDRNRCMTHQHRELRAESVSQLDHLPSLAGLAVTLPSCWAAQGALWRRRVGSFLGDFQASLPGRSAQHSPSMWPIHVCAHVEHVHGAVPARLKLCDRVDADLQRMVQGPILPEWMICARSLNAFAHGLS